MTRIFGYESLQPSIDEQVMNREVARVYGNLQASLRHMYRYGWQAHALDMIAITQTQEVIPVTIFKGYQGIKPHESLWEITPPEIQTQLASRNIASLFCVLESGMDEGRDDFYSVNWTNEENAFPIETKNYFYMTMGSYSHRDFNDQQLPWYDEEKPWLSIQNYLDSEPLEVNFDWIDPRRNPFVVCVNKNGQEVIVSDNYSANNLKHYSYFTDEKNGIRTLGGVRNQFGIMM